MTGLVGPYEIWIVLLIALLLFGHRIPGMARALGSGIVEFKRGLKGEPDQLGRSAEGGEKLPPATPPERKGD
jgi:sec-independent protein translocase protein TatA